MPATYLQFTLENAQGYSLTLNDVTTDPQKVYTITESPEFQLDVRTNKRDRLGRHFVKTDYSFYGERIITFKGQIAVFNESVSDLETMVANLRKLVSLPPLPKPTDNGFVTIKWSDERGLDWQLQAKIIADVKITSIFGMPWVRNYEITMLAEDGLIYSQDIYSVSGSTAYFGGSLILPVSLPAIMPSVWWNEINVNNQGNFPAPATFKIYGYAENPVITHSETGYFIKLDGYTVPAGRYVEVDVAQGTIELDDGTDLSGYLSTDSTWFYIDSGSNTIRLTHDASYLLGMLVIEWQNTEI
jgi:hypothetical protein